MKIIIAGSRAVYLTPYELLLLIRLTVSSYKPIHEIISGGCPSGPDRTAKEFAKVLEYPYKEFPADWDKHGKAAGPIRNKEMAVYADALLLIWDGESKGSKSMKSEMLKQNKPVYEIIIRYIEPSGQK